MVVARGSFLGLVGLEETSDRNVACSASDLQGLNFESCVWTAVSSHSSHNPQEFILARFSLYVHKVAESPIHLISLSDIKSTKSFIPKLSVIEGIHDTISIPILDNSIKISENSNINQICPMVTEEGNNKIVCQIKQNFIKLPRN